MSDFNFNVAVNPQSQKIIRCSKNRKYSISIESYWTHIAALIELDVAAVLRTRPPSPVFAVPIVDTTALCCGWVGIHETHGQAWATTSENRAGTVSFQLFARGHGASQRQIVVSSFTRGHGQSSWIIRYRKGQVTLSATSVFDCDAWKIHIVPASAGVDKRLFVAVCGVDGVDTRGRHIVISSEDVESYDALVVWLYYLQRPREGVPLLRAAASAAGERRNWFVITRHAL